MKSAAFFGVVWAAEHLFNRDTPPGMVLFLFFPDLAPDLAKFPAVYQYMRD